MKTIPILIAYTKEINQRKHAKQPSKTVNGNTILMVSEETVNFFNIPTYQGSSLLFQEIRSYSREINKSQVKITDYTRIKRGFTKGRTVRLKPSKTKVRASYLITFPYFFNLSMIRDSLFLLLKKNKEKCRFQVLQSQKNRDIYIGNDVNVSIPLKLIETKNTEYTDWGDVCLINPYASPKTLAKDNPGLSLGRVIA